MKCDELKAYNVVATADVNPEVVDSLGCTEWAGYDKSEVDAAIAELKAENVRLKRALWLARALRARDKAFEYHFKNNVEMCAKWDNVHLMLMAKAEEYK